MITRIGVVVAALLAFGLFAVACDGGGDALTLEEYFERLAGLDAELNERSNELDTQFSELSEMEQLAESSGLFAEQGGVIETFANGVADLNPPEEAEEAHNDTVEAMQEFSDLFQQALDDMEDDPATIDDLFAPFGSEEFQGASARTGDTCAALQQIADENESDVTLTCSNSE